MLKIFPRRQIVERVKINQSNGDGCQNHSVTEGSIHSLHRRRIKTEEKATVVTAVWGDIICSIPCHASYFFCTRTILKNKMTSSFSSNHPGAVHPILKIVLVQNSWRGKKLNKFCPPKQQRRPFVFSSVFILLLCSLHKGCEAC